jgi:hypothetical protein
MNTRYSLAGGSLIAALLTSTTAFADVTPADVWGGWRAYMESYGYEVTADENEAGGTLTISNFAGSFKFPEEDGMVTVTMGEIAFTDLGNGSVGIIMPETLPMNVLFAGPYETISAQVAMTNSGLNMVVSGTPEKMQYAYVADQMGLSLTDFKVDGSDEGMLKFDLTMADLDGGMTYGTGDMLAISQVVNSGTITYDFQIETPEGEGMTYSGQLASSEMLSVMNLPAGGTSYIENMGAALNAGMMMNASFSTGAGQSQFTFKDGSDQASGNSSTTSNELSMNMSKDALQYGVTSMGLNFAMTTSEVPLPIMAAAEEITFDLAMPVSKSETPQDFSLLTRLIGFAPDEMLWGIADPGGALPHDPADLIIDLSGKANWLFDILDPEQAGAMAMDMPGEIHALDVNELRLALAGAELTGVGDFTFDMNDLSTFDGLPAPDGKVDLRLVGANGLMDKLIQMGLLSQDDAMGARMMMGMFGRPGESDDELLSTIEVKATGEISANGQRLQ